MAPTKANPRSARGAAGIQEGFSSEVRREPYTPIRGAALVALRKSLDRATEPALRERLSLAIASLERRRA